MTEQEAFAAIRNALRLENLGRVIAAKASPVFRKSFKDLRRLIEAMPEGSLEREFQYKQMESLIRSLFSTPARVLYSETMEGLVDEVPKQLDFSKQILEAQGVTTPPVQVTRTQAVQAAAKTEVLGKTLDRLFGEGYFEESVKKNIDRVVKQGFLQGLTNDEIARNMMAAENKTIGQARAITRTSIMDMSAKSQNAFWDANDSVIKLWEFDATFDYRVCPRCYPFDGKRAEDRSSLPDTPVHPNCRCRILPLTDSALELEKEQMAKGELTMNTVEIGSPPPNARVYKKKVKVDGEKTTRFGVTYKVPRGERPTAALFLRRTNAETRAAVLGKDNARRFGEMLRDGRDEVDALQEIIKHPTRRRKSKRRS